MVWPGGGPAFTGILNQGWDQHRARPTAAALSTNTSHSSGITESPDINLLRSDDTEALESGNRLRVELMVASIQTRVEPRGHCPGASVDPTEARKDAGHPHAVGGPELKVGRHREGPRGWPQRERSGDGALSYKEIADAPASPS